MELNPITHDIVIRIEDGDVQEILGCNDEQFKDIREYLIPEGPNIFKDRRQDMTRQDVYDYLYNIYVKW